ncbi:acyl-CoA reductase [Rubritalea marina]|uniref:acyl-CoA reductase n=1 Tax=Rubritalea marina TaxID=361055 RepID=UPI000371E32A|nr:acyl-CoA reductase [Rubritalea marina]
MNTEERAHHLAKAAAPVARFLGEFSANDLLDWLQHELGDWRALDDFQQVGNILTKAKALKLLHVVSGNTPHAGLQSMLRGLLIGAENCIKVPSSLSLKLGTDAQHTIPALGTFFAALPTELQARCHFTTELDDHTLSSADCVIAIGSDEAIAAVHARLTPQQRFIPHGHKLSIGLIDKPNSKHAQLAARDASIFNQNGCLSPHAIYVQQDAAAFAPMLAEAMERYAESDPRGEIGLSESGAIRNLRETTRYRAAQSPEKIQLYESDGDTRWTVIYDESPRLELCPGNRCIYVRPWPEDLSTLGSEVEYLSTIALAPLPKLLDTVAPLEAPRICQLGQAQFPDLFWHHDGFAPLASLVTWQDIHL